MAQPGLPTPTGRWCRHLTGEWSKTAAACSDAGSRAVLHAPTIRMILASRSCHQDFTACAYMNGTWHRMLLANASALPCSEYAVGPSSACHSCMSMACRNLLY